MNSLFSYLIVLHIAGGTAGLISGSIAASVPKGNNVHRLSGKIFFFGMLAASLSALIISWLPDHHNVFLFAVGGFTFYMITTGYRIVFLKRSARQHAKPFTAIDYLLFLFGLCFGIVLLIMGIDSVIGGNTFGVVPCVFGMVCMNYARMDYQLISGKEAVKTAWMTNHITRMMGAMIASYTAFLVVNVHIQQQWILWLLPTVVGSILISKFLKNFAPRKKEPHTQN